MATFDQFARQGYQRLSRPSYGGAGGQATSMATPYLNEANPAPSSAQSYQPMHQRLGNARGGGGQGQGMGGWNWGPWSQMAGQQGQAGMSPPYVPPITPQHGPPLPPITPPTSEDIPEPPPMDTGAQYPPGQSPYEQWEARWGEAWRRRQQQQNPKPTGGNQTPPYVPPIQGGGPQPLPPVYTHPSHPAENPFGNPYAVAPPPGEKLYHYNYQQPGQSPPYVPPIQSGGYPGGSSYPGGAQTPPWVPPIQPQGNQSPPYVPPIQRRSMAGFY